VAERRKFKKRYCKYCEAKIDYIDYKDLNLLKISLSERFKIMPRRLTGNCKRTPRRIGFTRWANLKRGLGQDQAFPFPLHLVRLGKELVG